MSSSSNSWKSQAKPSLDLAFLCRVNRPFSGGTIYRQGIGGTQTALIYLARELAELGHRVQVYCHCGDEAGLIDGVHYRPVPDLVPAAHREPPDVLITVADEHALRLGIPARRRVWWSHNDYSHLWEGEFPDITAQLAADLAMQADKLITTSRWQTEVLKDLLHIPDEHFWQTRNGIHWPYFEVDPLPPRFDNRLIYTSVPDRGLDVLLACFTAMKEVVPDLELHVFSGFDLWGKPPEWCLAMTEPVIGPHRGRAGVIWHETVPQAELARELMQSTLWVYPNHAAPTTHYYAETSCIAALEAQAAGLPAVSSHRGALPETILAGETGILIPGDAHSEDYQKAFVQAVLDLLALPERGRALGRKGRERIASRFTWKAIAREWSDCLGELVESATSTRLAAPPLPQRFPPPKVSVIMPTYNRARNLRNALTALLDQTYREFEVLVCDDGSTDETEQVVRSFRDRLNIRYLRQEHRGFRAGPARNMGIAEARGKVLVFLDSDVIVGPRFLEVHVACHQQRRSVVVNSFVYRMTADHPELADNPPHYDQFPRRFADLLAPDSRERFHLFEPGTEWDQGYFLDSNALSLRGEDIQKVGGFDPELVGWGHEDTELGLRLAAAGYRFLFLRGEATAYHQYHPPSPTKEEERAANWDRLVKKHGIAGWYLPLSSIAIEGRVLVREQGTAAQEEIPPESFWDGYKKAFPGDGMICRRHLEVGQNLSTTDVCAVIVVQDGVVVDIKPCL